MNSFDLVREVQKHPILYDPKFKCSSQIRDEKWEEIAKQFRLDAFDVRSRWQSLREKYARLRKRVDANPSIADQLHNNKLAESMSFLDDSIAFYSKLHQPSRHKSCIPVARSWDKSHTLILIKQLARHQLLYDSTHPLYAHKVHRVAAYRKIADVLKPYKPEVTPEAISSKIRTVRTQYCKEKKYLKRFVEKYGRRCEPKLWFYNKLSFLEKKYSSEEQTHDSSNMLKFELDEQVECTDEDDDDVIEWLTPLKDNSREPHFEIVQISQKDNNNFADEETLDNSDVEIEEIIDHGESESDHSPNKSKRDEIYDKCSGLLNSFASELMAFKKDGNAKGPIKCKCKKSSPSTLLGQMIETELAQVSEQIYLDAKWKIIRILEEAQRNHSAMSFK